MARGKYADFDFKALPKYAPAFSDKPASFADTVAAEKVKATLMFEGRPTLSALARLYIAARKEKEEVDDLLTAAQAKLTAIEQLFIDQSEAEGQYRTGLDGGASVSIQIEPFAQVIDKAANRQWAIDRGWEADLTLPWATVNSRTKEALLEGLPEPPGVKVFAKTKIVFRKG